MEKVKKKMGRPKKIINKKTFEGLCSIQCTYLEICDILEVSDKTLNNWCRETYKQTFSEVFKKKSATGKASLRRMQYKNAENGNATMQIWLGKQYLGQKDKQELEHSGSVDFTKKTVLIDKYLGGE